MNRFPRARGRHRHTPGTMNKTEARYAATLELEKMHGKILGYWFEAVTLRLAKRTGYTPDFLVMLADCTLEFREVKGFWEDDARVKAKVAVEMFPMFGFVAISPRAQKYGGGWEIERLDGIEPTPAKPPMNFPGTVIYQQPPPPCPK